MGKTELQHLDKLKLPNVTQPVLSLMIIWGWLFLVWLLYEPDKAMAPHSSTLAWRIPWTEERGRLQSMGSLRVGHD